MSTYSKILYNAEGAPFTAPDEETAKMALKSGNFFEEAPQVTTAATLGLIPVEDSMKIGARFNVDRSTGLTTLYDVSGKTVQMRPVDAKEALRTGTFFTEKPSGAASKDARNRIGKAAASAARTEQGATKEEADKAAQEAMQETKSLTDQVKEEDEKQKEDEKSAKPSRTRN